MEDEIAARFGVHFCPHCERHWPLYSGGRCINCETSLGVEGTFPPYDEVYARTNSGGTAEILLGHIGVRPHIVAQIVDTVGLNDRMTAFNAFCQRFPRSVAPEDVFMPAPLSTYLEALHQIDDDEYRDTDRNELIARVDALFVHGPPNQQWITNMIAQFKAYGNA